METSSTQNHTAETLAGVGVFDLRRIAREVLGGHAAISSANRQRLTAAILSKDARMLIPNQSQAPMPLRTDSDGAPVPPKIERAPSGPTPDLNEAFRAFVELTRPVAPTIDADAVESIVRGILDEEANRDTKDGLILKTIADEIKKAFDAAPVVKVQVGSGPVKKLDGIQHRTFPRLLSLANAGIRTWIAGPAGSGKTTAAVKVAEALEAAVFVQPPSLTRYDVLGYLDAQSNVIDTQTSSFVRHRGPKVLLFDEVDSWGPGAQMAANLLLANGHAILPDGRFEIAPDGERFWICATANTWGNGADAKYCGRQKLDGAFLDRWDARLFWDYDEEATRRIADAMIPEGSDKKDACQQAIAKSRAIRSAMVKDGVEATFSPRRTFAAVRAILCGDSVETIFADLMGGLPESVRARYMAL